MTRALPGQEVAQQIGQRFPEAIIEAGAEYVLVRREDLVAVAHFLKGEPTLDFNYLAAVTGVDYLDYFEVVYHLTSLNHNHSLVFKTRAQGRLEPTVPSLCSIWRGAELQEREVYDLLGIHFSGHPDLRRVLLWEGFAGHPLRKDYLELKGGPGL